MDGIASPPQFVGSEAFAVAFAWGLVLVGVGGPLLVECHQHLSDGHVLFGCTFGVAALLVGGICLWRIGAALGHGRPNLERASSSGGD